MRHLLLILATALLALTGCRHSASDPAMRHALAIVDSLPARTLAILDSVPQESLSGHDLYLHRFLTVKANDKLFVRHTSDSLLLQALRYGQSNPASVNLPELLYYAGRVYTDIGDYPTALDYYHQALDRLPETEPNLDLRAKVLSNISGVYFSCYLNDEAKSYLRQAMRLDSIMCDTLNLVYDLIDLSHIYYDEKRYNDASIIDKQILSLSDPKYPGLAAVQYVDLARIKLCIGETDSARLYIRDNVDKVDKIYAQNHAFATAAEIYAAAGIPDSAFYYAMEVLKNNDPFCKERAYSVLLKPALADYVPKDSIYPYVRAMVRKTQEALDQNGSKLTLIRSSQYNYSIQQRERIKAEEKANRLYVALIIALALILIVTVLFFLLKLNSQKQKLKIAEYQRDIAFLKNEILNLSVEKEEDGATTEADAKRAELKQELLDRLQHEIAETTLIQQREPLVSDSLPYKELCTKLRNGQDVNENDPVWNSLENTILQASPKFIYNLELLLEHKPNEMELSTAMLIKCHFSPTEIAKILNRTKGTISHRREMLGEHIFGKKVPVKMVDMVIKIL